MRPKKAILCVDDNEKQLSITQFLLQTRGYYVIPAGSASQALDYLISAPIGSLSLLLTDLLMPQMDGNELARRAKELHPGLPVLVFSGTVRAYESASAADVFLPKGANTPIEILERVRVLAARQRPPDRIS